MRVGAQVERWLLARLGEHAMVERLLREKVVAWVRAACGDSSAWLQVSVATA